MTRKTSTVAPQADDRQSARDDFLARWNALGQRIVTLAELGTPFYLDDKVRYAERLVVELMWKLAGASISLLARLLLTSRQRVRKSVVSVRKGRR